MIVFWRKIKKETKKIWIEGYSRRNQFIENNEFPATFFDSWAEDSPSIWKIEDSDEKLKKEDIFFAIYEGCKAEDNIYFIGFNSDAIKKAELELRKTDGNTKIQRIDQSGSHFEIPEFSSKKIQPLLYEIIRDGWEFFEYKTKDHLVARNNIINERDTLRAISQAENHTSYPSGAQPSTSSTDTHEVEAKIVSGLRLAINPESNLEVEPPKTPLSSTEAAETS